MPGVCRIVYNCWDIQVPTVENLTCRRRNYCHLIADFLWGDQMLHEELGIEGERPSWACWSRNQCWDLEVNLYCQLSRGLFCDKRSLLALLKLVFQWWASNDREPMILAVSSTSQRPWWLSWCCFEGDAIVVGRFTRFMSSCLAGLNVRDWLIHKCPGSRQWDWEPHRLWETRGCL